MKNKVVYFPKGGTPRIYSTLDPDSLVSTLGDGLSLINPNLDLVFGIPPELWTLDAENKIIPLVGAQLEEKMAERTLTGLLTSKDEHIKDNIHKLVDIPEALEILFDKLDDQHHLSQEMNQNGYLHLGAKMEMYSDQYKNTLKATALEIKNFLQTNHKDMSKKMKETQILIAVSFIVILILGVFLIYK